MFIYIIGVKTNLSMAWPRGGQGGRIGTFNISTVPERFKSPTTGSEDVFFTTGTNEDGANFIKTKK